MMKLMSTLRLASLIVAAVSIHACTRSSPSSKDESSEKKETASTQRSAPADQLNEEGQKPAPTLTPSNNSRSSENNSGANSESIDVPLSSSPSPSPETSTPPPEKSTPPPDNNLPASNIRIPPPTTERNPNLVPTSDSILAFNAIVFTNMEHGKHATDAGSMVVLHDSQTREVIAAGDLTLASAVHGLPQNAGGAYPVSRLKVDLNFISERLPVSGVALLSICPVELSEREAGTFACAKTDNSGGSDRPVYWNNKQVNYTRDGKNIGIDNKAWGNGGTVNYGLSFSHAFTMGAIGGSVRQFADASSPLVLDLNKNRKFDLISARDNIYNVKFDLNASGVNSRVGWVKPSDGLLALDVNGNGIIDNGSELFGEYSHSLKPIDKWEFRNFKNGFEALAQYDSNADGAITEKDAIYSKIMVWTDKNTNGINDKGELKSLKSMGISSINLDFKATGKAFNFTRVADNEVRYVGSYRSSDGKLADIADVWFSNNRDSNIVSKK